MEAKEIKSARFQIAYWRDYAKYCDSKVAHAVRVLFPVGARVKIVQEKLTGIVVGYGESKGGGFRVMVAIDLGQTVLFLPEALKLEGEE